jgi:hypothetical protein
MTYSHILAPSNIVWYSIEPMILEAVVNAGFLDSKNSTNACNTLSLLVIEDRNTVFNPSTDAVASHYVGRMCKRSIYRTKQLFLRRGFRKAMQSAVN